MKVALATCKMYVSMLPEPELALACVVVCGGAVLFLLGWRLDQFFEPELPGAPQLPLKLSANGIQVRCERTLVRFPLCGSVAPPPPAIAPAVDAGPRGTACGGGGDAAGELAEEIGETAPADSEDRNGRVIA